MTQNKLIEQIVEVLHKHSKFAAEENGKTQLNIDDVQAAATEIASLHPLTKLSKEVERLRDEAEMGKYEFEKQPKLTEFIQEMASTGRVPQEWTSFIETLNQALRIHAVSGRSEQLPCDCNVKLAETTLQVYCPKCYKTHKMK